MHAWIAEATKHIGITEIKGPKHSSVITSWLQRLGAWWFDDETPWCGVFVAQCIAEAGLPVPKYWMRARDWLNWGTQINRPAYGCIVVFSREGGGHVGFVVGIDEKGRLMVLGGNQKDAVSIVPFDHARVLGYRWPEGVMLDYSPLPVYRKQAESSQDEA
jgi:uncharacterized protein (TIGR02594 family)